MKPRGSPVSACRLMKEVAMISRPITGSVTSIPTGPLAAVAIATPSHSSQGNLRSGGSVRMRM